jgi:hypothetical protein
MFLIKMRRWLCLPIIFMMMLSHAYASINSVKQGIQHQNMMQQSIAEHPCHQPKTLQQHHQHTALDCHSTQQPQQSCIDACQQWHCQINMFYFTQLPTHSILPILIHHDTVLNFQYHSQYLHQPYTPLLRPPKA